MNSAFYTAASGMKAFQSELDVTANNLSNVNTTGFKASKVTFDELMKTQMNTKAAGEHLVGHGMKVGQVKTLNEAGKYVPSDSLLDFAVIGEGYFAIQGDEDDEEPLYTRDGSFQISATEDGSYLTTRDGRYVLGADGDYIELEYKIVKDKDGREEETNQLDLSNLRERLGLFVCDNPAGLLAAGSNRFRSGETSGEWYAVEEEEGDGDVTVAGRIVSGMLEGSNTEIGTEMAHIIESQRGLQINGRIVTIADQIEEMINNLR